MHNKSETNKRKQQGGQNKRQSLSEGLCKDYGQGELNKGKGCDLVEEQGNRWMVLDQGNKEIRSLT